VVGATVASEVTADRQRGLPPLCSPPEHAIMPVMLPPPIMPNLYASLGRKGQSACHPRPRRGIYVYGVHVLCGLAGGLYVPGHWR
jgi:hypothetical protein